MSEPCVIRQGFLDRWFIFKPQQLAEAWSGSRWVPCNYDGTPIKIHVCNFETEQEARDYCREIGLEPL